jgi:hypothetical protein
VYTRIRVTLRSTYSKVKASHTSHPKYSLKKIGILGLEPVNLSIEKMVSIRNLALAAATMIGLTTAAPAEKVGRQTFMPGTQNNTQEFYIHLNVTHGPTTYNGWSCKKDLLSHDRFSH